MYHLAFCLLLVLGVDAMVPHSHYVHISRRFHGHPQSLDAFPRSSHALNPVYPPVDPKSGPSEHVQARQLKRQVADHDWARNASVEPSPNEPKWAVNYLSKTGPIPAAQPDQPVPATESSAKAAPVSASPPADPPFATSPHEETKISHDEKGPQYHHKGDSRHHAGRSKKMMKKTVRL